MIEIQSLNGSPAYRREANHTKAIPTKVFAPAVIARVEQGYGPARLWIGSLNAIGFPQVAAGTSPSQVVEMRSPAT